MFDDEECTRLAHRTHIIAPMSLIVMLAAALIMLIVDQPSIGDARLAGVGVMVIALWRVCC